MDRPNLLMVCYFHPPAATGVRRLLSLARDLPAHGWHPMVICCDHTAGMGWDDSPLQNPAIASIPVVRTESMDPYRLLERWRSRKNSNTGERGAASVTGTGGRSRAIMDLLRRHVFLPDDRTGWTPFAVRAGVRAAREHPIRAIYSSNFPHSAHVAAMRIKQRTGLPWLADFRDGWTRTPILPPPANPILRRAQARLERKVVRTADQVVTVSPPITRQLQQLRGSKPPEVETVFNGFDPVVEYRNAGGPLHPGKTTILYSGTFFSRRKPDTFLQALGDQLARQPGLRDKVRVRFRCALDGEASSMIGRLGLDETVEVLPPIPFEEIKREQQRADGFLLVLERGPGADIMVSQKIFEYLGAKKPIFALIPPGAALEVLEDTGGATVCTSENREEAAGALGQYMEQLLAGNHPLADPQRLATFERSRQSERMAALLDAMTAGCDGSSKSGSD